MFLLCLVLLFIVLPPSTFSMPQSPTFPVPQNMLLEIGEKRSGVTLISSTNISALTLTRHLKIIFLSDSSLEILYIAPLFLLFLFFNWMMNTILSYKHINILFFVVKLSYIKWKVHWCLNSLAKFPLMLFISFCGSCGQRRDSLESPAQLSEQWDRDLGVIWSSL